MTTEEEQPKDPVEDLSASERASSAFTADGSVTKSPDRKPTKSEVRAQRLQESQSSVSDETENNLGDSTGAVTSYDVSPVLASLDNYEYAIAKNNQSLAYALSLYRSQLADGVATQAPPAITPELVGKSLSSGRLAVFQNILEHLRNAFIFMPVLWTWLQLGLAIKSYNAIRAVGENALVADKTFLDLWAGGFEIEEKDYSESLPLLEFIGAESFQSTAIIAVAFIFALVVMTFLVGILRSVNSSRLRKYEVQFAGILGQASFFHINITAETPQEQIFEFSRIGRQLTGSIQTLTTAFQQETSSMSAAIQSAQSSAQQSAEMAKAQFDLVNNSVKAMDESMTTLTALVDKQATQLGDVVESLSNVSDLADQLGEIRKQFAETSTSLTKIEGELGPAATILTESVTLMNDLVTKLDQASGNLGKALLQHDNFTTKMHDAAQSINLVSNRFLDSTEKE